MRAILQQTMGTFGRRLSVLAGLAAAVYLPLTVVGSLIRTSSIGDAASAAKVAEVTVSFLGLLVLPLLNAAVLHIAHADREKRAVGAMAAVRSGLSSWFPLIVGYIAISFAVLGWMVVGLIPGLLTLWLVGLDKTYFLVPFLAPAIYMAARYGFMETLIVVRGRDPYSARHESMRLSKGKHARMFVTGITLIGVPLALEQLAPTIGEQLASAGPPALIAAAGVDLLAGILNLIYLVFFFHWYSSLEQQKDGPQ
jgi:hypothetical protein